MVIYYFMVMNEIHLKKKKNLLMTNKGYIVFNFKDIFQEPQLKPVWSSWENTMFYVSVVVCYGFLYIV